MSASKRLKTEGARRPVAVLHPDVEAKTVPTVKALVGLVRERKNLSRVLAVVCKKFPLTERQQFLKRVRPEEGGAARVIVKIEVEEDVDDVVGTDVRDLFDAPLEVVEIPARAARTRTQWQDARARWPCRFHEDAAVEAAVAGTAEAVWGEEALSAHRSHLAEAENCDGAVLVDPATGTVVVAAEDMAEGVAPRCPLDHPVMRMIDSLASKQRDSAHSSSSSSGYLCTGLDVYLSSEPCLMCAMALVHSRAARVFFGRADPSRGGLVSATRLHCAQGLNHTYEVYQFV